MRALILLAFAIFPILSSAQPIIIDQSRLENLTKSVRSNPFFLKVGLAKVGIFYFEVGSAQTPFYESNGQVKRFYKNKNKCFELSILENKNLAQRVRCFDKSKTVYLPGFEEFKTIQLNTLIEEGLQGFKIIELSQTFELQAFIQTIDLYNIDRSVYGDLIDQTAPRRKFKTYLENTSEVILSKKQGLELRQNLELSVDKIGILDAKTSKSSNTIKLLPRGLIFSNSKGKILIYNPPLPKPFGDYQLLINPKLPDHLGLLADQSQSGPVCFRDDYISPSSKDCHRLIFETIPFERMNKIKILAIDFAAQKIDFL